MTSASWPFRPRLRVAPTLQRRRAPSVPFPRCPIGTAGRRFNTHRARTDRGRSTSHRSPIRYPVNAKRPTIPHDGSLPSMGWPSTMRAASFQHRSIRNPSVARSARPLRIGFTAMLTQASRAQTSDTPLFCSAILYHTHWHSPRIMAPSSRESEQICLTQISR